MNNKTVWLIVAAIVIIGAIAWSMNREDDSMVKNEETMMEEEKTEEVMTEEKKEEGAMMEKSGSYKDYSTATVAAEQAAGNKVVLFFHATWCPYCKAADTAFKAKGDDIPSGVTVLKTDYDSNTELKTKYGVTTQHTFVQIDAEGNQVTKWVSGDVSELKANLK